MAPARRTSKYTGSGGCESPFSYLPAPLNLLLARQCVKQVVSLGRGHIFRERGLVLRPSQQPSTQESPKMCRWLAYRGPSLPLEALLLAPEHSILDQSRHAERTNFEINGDGFGLGWYGKAASPGVFHDVRPAWNDRNLRSVAAHVESHLFMAHIRATTGSPVSRSNCHPFAYGDWLFAHNGQIGGYASLRHALDVQIDPVIYASRVGTTDTEAMFQLALTFGLQDDPVGGILRMIDVVESEREKHGVSEPFEMTVALANGERLWAFRHSSDKAPPSLYYNAPGASLRDADGASLQLQPGAALVLSEPLDRDPENWIEVPPESRLSVQDGQVQVEPLMAGAA